MSCMKILSPSQIVNQLSTDSPIPMSPNPAMMGLPQAPNLLRSPAITQPAASSPGTEGRVLDKRRLQELVKEVDPLEQLDEDVEEVRYHTCICDCKRMSSLLLVRLLQLEYVVFVGYLRFAIVYSTKFNK